MRLAVLCARSRALCLPSAAYWKPDPAQVWTYTGEISAAEGKPLEPMCLHVYVRPATIESFKDVQGAWRDDNTSARHSLSPGVRFSMYCSTTHSSAATMVEFVTNQ